MYIKIYVNSNIHPFQVPTTHNEVKKTKHVIDNRRPVIFSLWSISHSLSIYLSTYIHTYIYMHICMCKHVLNSKYKALGHTKLKSKVYKIQQISYDVSSIKLPVLMILIMIMVVAVVTIMLFREAIRYLGYEHTHIYIYMYIHTYIYIIHIYIFIFLMYMYIYICKYTTIFVHIVVLSTV